MLLELGRALSFFLSILSLYAVLMSAFFVPGSQWQERLAMSVLKIALAACVSFFSGLLFSWPSPVNPRWQSLMSTLPVRMFFWAMACMAILFAVSWYLEEYYLPLLPHPCCRP
jgi:cation transport ATPase